MMSHLFKLWKACALLGILMISGQLLTNVGLDDALRLGVFAAIGLFALVGLAYGLLGREQEEAEEALAHPPLRVIRSSPRRWSRTASASRLAA